jgi:hypothetical protein
LEIENDPLTTLDEFGSRRFVIPAEARGLWRRRRTLVYYVLIVFFLVLPWIKINRVQALLIGEDAGGFGRGKDAVLFLDQIGLLLKQALVNLAVHVESPKSERND